MYCITLRNKFDKTIIGWYDASASNFSTDQRRAKLFLDRVDADLVAELFEWMDEVALTAGGVVVVEELLEEAWTQLDLTGTAS